MKSVYKYMSEVAAVSFLKDPWIRVTPKPALNDPFECTPTQSTKDEILNSFQGKSVSHDHQDLIVHSFEGVMDYFGIVSLSRSFNNMLMWSHYADSHKGVMLELDLDEIHKSTSLYTDKIEDSVIYSDFRAFNGKVSSQNEARRHYFLRKSQSWAYEDEYRLVLPVNLGLKVAFDLSSEGSKLDMVKLGLEPEIISSDSRFTDKLFLDNLPIKDLDKLFDVWLNSSETNTQFYQYIGYKALKRIYLGSNSNIEKFKALFDELADDPEPYRLFKSISTNEYNEIYHMQLDADKYELTESLI